MLDAIIRYFLPVERHESRWRYSAQRYHPTVRIYIMRNGVPTFLFWGLGLIFMQSQPLFSALCLSITLPFAYMFGLMVRAWLDLSKI